MADKYIKYFTATIKVEADSEDQLDYIGRNIENWIEDTLIDDSMFCDGSVGAEMISWGENSGRDY